MDLAVIGAGYVGLVTGACLADFGHVVTCVDKDAAKIAALKTSRIPIFEPGLDDIVEQNCKAGRLHLPPTSSAAVQRRGRGLHRRRNASSPWRRARRPDLRVRSGARDRAGARWLHARHHQIDRAGRHQRQGRGNYPGRPGRTPNSTSCRIRNFSARAPRSKISSGPDRIVVGTTERAGARRRGEHLSAALPQRDADRVHRRERTSELIKYAANAFLATKITFINEMADICERVGANVQDVARGMGLDGRIGSKFLHAGPGYGGSCFPKDTLALIKTAEDHATCLAHRRKRSRRSTMRASAPWRRKIVAALRRNGERGKTIAILGLTFKPNTDDMREAPSLAIIAALPRMPAP